MVTGAGAGLACAPEDPGALSQTVREFLAMTDVERREMGARGLAAVRNIYAREKLVGKIEAVLRSVVEEQGWMRWLE